MKKALILLLLLVAGFFAYQRLISETNLNKFKTQIVPEVVKKLINDPNALFKIESVKETSGLYEVALTIGEGQNAQKFTSYITKDGQIFFTSGVKIASLNQPKAQEVKGTKSNIPKEDKPQVELFVMSYCPYGTQIEKGILPVIETLKDKINFSLKFVAYAMHGEKEIDENLRQYCIQKQEQTKLNDYLKCFLKEGKSETCTSTSNLNLNLISNCIENTNSQFKVKDKYNDKSSWNSQYPPFDVNKEDNNKYNVQGSPTLVINGTTVDSSRDSASLLKTICSSFSKQPKECSAKLSSDTPAAGFGSENTNNAGASASCATQ